MRRVPTLTEPVPLDAERVSQAIVKLRGTLPAYPVALAYLFGSHGRLVRGTGRPHPLSDVDIAVLYDSRVDDLPAPPWGWAANLIGVFADALGREDIDLLELNGASPRLLHSVLRDGVLLYAASPASRLAFETDARRRYLDMQPYLRYWDEARAQRLRKWVGRDG